MTAIFGPLSSWLPPADVRETEKDFRFIVDLPGVAEDQLSVQGEHNVLTIRGDRASPDAKGNDRGDVVLKERTDGRFVRSFVLPETAQLDKAEAQLANGLLCVTIPKGTAPRKHVVPIRRTAPSVAQGSVRSTADTTSQARAERQRTGGASAEYPAARLVAPELLPLAAQLLDVLRRLYQLRRQRGYALHDVAQLQDALREIEMHRRADGTFGGRADYAGTSAREALLMSLLSRAHRLASSLLNAAEIDPANEPLEKELGEIEAALIELGREASVRADDERLHRLQERLDAVDAKRHNAAFPGPRGEPLPGQAFLHNLLEHCYDLVSRLQDPQAHAGEVDPQLQSLHAQLKQVVNTLEDLDRRGSPPASTLQAIRDSLLELERHRIAGVFGGSPSAPPPKGQAVLSSLLHRAFRLLRIMELRL